MYTNNKIALVITLPMDDHSNDVRSSINNHNTQLLVGLRQEYTEARLVTLSDLLNKTIQIYKNPQKFEVLIPLIYLTGVLADSPTVNRLIDHVNGDDVLIYRYVDKDGVTFKCPKSNRNANTDSLQSVHMELNDIRRNMMLMQMHINGLQGITRGNQIYGQPPQAYGNPLGSGFGDQNAMIYNPFGYDNQRFNPFSHNQQHNNDNTFPVDRVLMLTDPIDKRVFPNELYKDLKTIPWCRGQSAYTYTTPDRNPAIYNKPFDFVVIDKRIVSVANALECLSKIPFACRYAIYTDDGFEIVKQKETVMHIVSNM